LYSFQSFFGFEIECFDYWIHLTKGITIELIQMKLLTIETTSMEVFSTQQIQNYGCTVSVPEIWEGSKELINFICKQLFLKYTLSYNENLCMIFQYFEKCKIAIDVQKVFLTIGCKLKKKCYCQIWKNVRNHI